MRVDGLRWKLGAAVLLSGMVALVSGPAISTTSVTLPAEHADLSVPHAEVPGLAGSRATHDRSASVEPAPSGAPRDGDIGSFGPRPRDEERRDAVPPSIAVPLAKTFGEPFALGRADPEGLLYTPNWAVLEGQIAADRAVLAGCRTEPGRCPEPARRLAAIAGSGRVLSGRRRLAEVNRAVNLAVAYTSDRRQYGRDNVWASPLATFASGKGDCKDYATAKYLALIEAGVRESELRVVVVRQAKAAEPLHAVLAVREGGEWLVLDNRRMALLSTAEARDYRALVAFRDTRLDLRPTLAVSEPAAGGSRS